MIVNKELVGRAFADHVREQDSGYAHRLAEALADIGDTRRAEVLLAFADRGECAVPAPWWSPESICHVGLQLPVAPARGDLWFDPLEVSFFVGLPWARPPRQPGVIYPDRPDPEWFGWLAIGPVTAWQAGGAHEIEQDIPATLGAATAEGALRFSELFGKSLSLSVSWNVLHRGYDGDMLRRVWGDHEAEFGRGGPRSGDFVILRRRQLEGWDPDRPGTPDDVYGRDALGLCFRTFASAQVGLLTPEDGALERRWGS